MRWFLLVGFIAFLLGIANAALFPMVSYSAPVDARMCIPYKQFVKMIEEKYQEKVEGRGLAANGWVTELYTNQERTSWTIIQVNPSGLACSRAYGVNWNLISKDKGV